MISKTSGNRNANGKKRARKPCHLHIFLYGTLSKNLYYNSHTLEPRLSTELRSVPVHSACDAKSEEHQRRRQEVKSARSSQSTVYVHAPFWTQTVTFSRWSPLSRRAVLGRAACRRQAANLRVVCSLPGLRKREVTRSEPQDRGDQARSRCCSRRVRHCTPRAPQPRTPTNAARRAAVAWPPLASRHAPPQTHDAVPLRREGALRREGPCT